MREVSAVIIAIGLFSGPPYPSCFGESTLLGSHGVGRNWPPLPYKETLNQAVQSEPATLNHRAWFRCGHVTHTGPVDKEHTLALLDPSERRRWYIFTRLMGWYLKPQSGFPSGICDWILGCRMLPGGRLANEEEMWVTQSEVTLRLLHQRQYQPLHIANAQHTFNEEMMKPLRRIFINTV